MHDLEKKLFQLEELLFLSLQTSLTKYISSMIDCNNKQQKFLFYGIQFFKSNYLHEKESNSFSPEDTTHRTTACFLPALRSGAFSGKQGSVLLGVLACSIRFAESDSLKSVCCMTYLIKNLNIYKNLGLWNSILFSVLQNKEFW